MRIGSEVRGQLAARFAVLLPHLNERQQRLALASEARLLGHGGVRAVANAAGVSETTVRKGVFELERGEDPLPSGRVRRAGGGRKRATQQAPELLSALLALVEPDERGDPMSPLRWTTKSLRHLADELTRQGHAVSAPTVGKLLRESGFSLQANAKTLEGQQHPDRDTQFRYINEQVKEHQAAGEPVISVDTKKKELLGRLPNAGREWRPQGEPIEVEDHSFFFTGPDVAQAIPYGIYDIAADTGWVNVGIDHDTSAFAVASIRRWWQARGGDDYPHATRLLITADAGGSNSYRYRLWKTELATLAAETGLAITVCHFPPGTSKWNKVEHRLFSHITLNWRGRPLTSHEVVVKTIASTCTRTGLRVHAELDTASYPIGVSVSTARMHVLPLVPHPWCGSWNYTLHPANENTADPAGPPHIADNADPAHARAQALEVLSDPLLTGMTRQELNELTAQLAAAQAAQTAQRCYEQRGGRRRRAAGAGIRPLLSDAARVLITVVYLRQICSQNVLSEMLEVNANSIGQAIAETRQLLDEHGHTISPTTLRFTTAQTLANFVTGTDTGTGPPRPRIPQVLSDPSLTGMSRQKLAEMIERLSHHQAARTERHRYRRRGAERLPGARGGVFRQKITDAERVLATVLYQRGLCTRETLAELFEVSRRTIGNALLEGRPPPSARRIHRDPGRIAIPHRSGPSRLRDTAQGHTGNHATTVLIFLRLHRARNPLSKIPKTAQVEVKADYWQIFEVPEDIEPGLDAVAFVQKKIDAFANRWRDAYPAAVRILLADRQSLTHYLRCPREHWTRVRHSNFIERTFGQTRRRAKVIGRPPGETSCISLVWAMLDRSSRGARGFTMTPTGLRPLQDLHRTLLQPPTPLRHTDPPATAPPQRGCAVQSCSEFAVTRLISTQGHSRSMRP